MQSKIKKKQIPMSLLLSYFKTVIVFLKINVGFMWAF